MKTVFDPGNVDLGIEGTQVTADFMNGLQNHRHDGGDEDGGFPSNYAVDTGIANAYVITLAPALTAHVPGMPILFKASASNTGASTIEIDGLAAVAIKQPDGAALASAHILAGAICEIVYDGESYQLLTAAYRSTVYAVDTGIANAHVITLPAPFAAHVAGLKILFKALFANTGPATLNINGLGAVAIKQNNGKVLCGGHIAAGQICEMVYDGVNYQFQNPNLVSRGCLVHHVGNMTLQPYAWTKVQFLDANKAYDTDGIHSDANNTRLVVPGGITRIQLIGQFSFSMTENETFAVTFHKNGSAEAYAGMPIQSGEQESSGIMAKSVNATSPVLVVAPGDYFEMVIAQGCNAAHSTTGDVRTWAWMKIID